MKKIIIIILVALLAGTFTTGTIIYIQKKDTKSNNKKLEYTIIRDGYSECENQIISSYDKLIEFTEEYDNRYIEIDTDKYNEEYFKDKYIAIINIKTGSSSFELQDINLSIKDNKLYCIATIKKPDSDVVTDDITGKVILVEINKDINDIELDDKYI